MSVLTRDKNSAKSLTLLIFAILWAVRGPQQLGRKSLMPVLSFLANRLSI